MDKPLVSVICICYNHSTFIEKAIQSVLNQHYRNIEIIIVDDGSTDSSRQVIEDIISVEKNIKSIFLDQNNGNCFAFNRGYEVSKGAFIIDLSADDELLPERIEKGIDCFMNQDSTYGINFTDALYIDKNSKDQKGHYKRSSSGQLIEKVPAGYIYPELLARYFICTPTMMMKREVFEFLGGYDETLSYEDFDFWIRTAKKFQYCYTDEILVRKRLLPDSSSSTQYKKNSPHLRSTYLVCLKAEDINENEQDRKALMKRLKYEIRKSILSGNTEIGIGLIDIGIRNSDSVFTIQGLKLLSKLLS